MVVLIVSLTCAIFIAFGLAVVLAWRLSQRQPYKTFLSLKTRQKVQFLKALITDRRIPLVAKLVPILLVPYLAVPFDVIPDFIPFLGYLDDAVIVVLALVLFVRLCPSGIVKELLEGYSSDSGVSEAVK